MECLITPRPRTKKKDKHSNVYLTISESNDISLANRF